MLDDFPQPVVKKVLGQGRKGLGVCHHSHRLMKRPYQVLAKGQVYPSLAPYAGICLGD